MKRKTLITSVVLASAATAAIPLSIVLSSKVKESTTLDEKVHARWEEIENELATTLGGFDVRSQDDVTRYENISQEAEETSAEAFKKLEHVVGYNDRGGFYVDKEAVQRQQKAFTAALNDWAKLMYGDESNKRRWINDVISFAIQAKVKIDNNIDGFKALAQHFNIAYDSRQQKDIYLSKHLIHFTELNDQSSDDEVIYEVAKLFMEGLVRNEDFGLTNFYEQPHFNNPIYKDKSIEQPIEVVLYNFFETINYQNISYDPHGNDDNFTDPLKDLRTANMRLARLENPNKPPQTAYSANNTVAFDLEGEGGVSQMIHQAGHSIVNPFESFGSSYQKGPNLTGVGVDAYLSELLWNIASYDQKNDQVVIKDEYKKMGLNIDVQKRPTKVQYNNKGKIEEHEVYDLNGISFSKDGVSKSWAPKGLKMYVTLASNNGINAVVLENWNQWIDSLDEIQAALNTFKNLAKPELYDIDQLISYIIPNLSGTNSGKPNLYTEFSNWWNNNGPTLFGLNDIVDTPEISASLNTQSSFKAMLNGATGNFMAVTNSILNAFTRIARTINPSSTSATHLSDLAKTYLISKSRVFASREWLNSKDYALSINMKSFNSIVKKYNINPDSIKIYVTKSYWGKTTSEVATNVLAFTPRAYEKSYDIAQVFNHDQINDKSLEDYPFNKKEMMGWQIAELEQGEKLHLTNDSVIKFELSLDKELKNQSLNNEQARLPQLFEFNDIGELYDL